jgi:C-terminal processing protease CtpA/Prc
MNKLLVIAVALIPLFVFAEVETIGYFGILSEPLSDAMKNALDIESGVIITKVYEDTPAAEGGFENGDVIYEIDGEKIDDIDALKKVIADRPNEKVVIKYLRSGDHAKETVTLGEKEKEILKFKIEMPDMEEMQEMLAKGKAEFKEQLENLQKEVELLKEEIEDIKRQLQEQ